MFCHTRASRIARLEAERLEIKVDAKLWHCYMLLPSAGLVSNYLPLSIRTHKTEPVVEGILFCIETHFVKVIRSR